MNTARLSSELISIAEAAERFGIHRRTIERWIKADRLRTTASDADRRKRLVDPVEVEALVQKLSDHRSSSIDDLPPRQSVTPLHSPTSDFLGTSAVGVPLPGQYQEIVDDTLQLVYSHYHLLSTAALSPDAFQPLTLEQLRDGPLGHDLHLLACLALGLSREPKEHVLKSIDDVLQLLFWPAAAEDFAVPRAFWDTGLGHMLSLAKYRSFRTSELISLKDAAERLGVSRPTIYKWMDDRTLDYVRDDGTGRTFIVRRDVDQLLRVTHTISSGLSSHSSPKKEGDA